jgi:Xaa-Pro aminopeptidase
MTHPTKCVPSQYPSDRTLRDGDVLITELSASFWGYPGQLLRTVTLGAEPTPLYRELHDVAEAAKSAICSRVAAGVHAQELFEAARLIGEAGFTIYDDLVHGFGGGYLPPVIGTDTRQNEPTPDVTRQAGMTIVVQPNVVTKDHSAGVQTGELIVVTDDGFEFIHSAPRGLLRR